MVEVLVAFLLGAAVGRPLLRVAARTAHQIPRRLW